jgi:predicted nicotinamide N-methyase
VRQAARTASAAAPPGAGRPADVAGAGRVRADASADAPPDADALAALLDRHAPFGPAPLCPELGVFHATSLVGVWEAAEALAGRTLPSPFWAYPWPGGAALARVILDAPALVAGRTVLDIGAGGGIAALACARAGARRVVANDVDPWALAVTRLAAARQELHVETWQADLVARGDTGEPFDVVLCSELAYERAVAPAQRALLAAARAAGATLLLADAGRAYFQPDGELLAAFTLGVPHDLEGAAERTARVYRIVGGVARP